MKDYNREEAMLVMMRRLTILMIFLLLSVSAGLYILYSSVKNDGYSYLGILVFSAGLLGGFVSIQQRLHKIKDEELRLLSASWLSTALIPINGGIFALILMLMFMAGLLQGNLFPIFPDLNVSNIDTFKDWLTFSYPQTGSGMAKLFFWSFVAGFSERFVPRLISNVASEGISSNQNESDTKKSDTATQMMPMKKDDKRIVNE